jgi:hypothetical protein
MTDTMDNLEVEINPMFKRESEKTPTQTVSKDTNPHELMIFDSIQLEFNPQIFLTQLLLHVVVLFAWLSPNPRAQGFGGSTLDSFYNIGLSLVVYIMAISYFLAPKDTFVILSGAVWIPLIYFLQHKLIVSLKYASLSSTEYNRFMSCKDPTISTLYRKQMQLISAWLNRDEAVLEFELGATAVRVGTKLSEVYCVLPNPEKSETGKSQILYWHAFLRGRDIVDDSIQTTDGLELRSDGQYQVSVFSILTALVRRCDTRNFGESFCFYVIYCFSFITIIIPLLVLANDRTRITKNIDYSWVTVFYTTSTIINVCFGPLVYNLLYVAIFDVLRQLQMVDELTAIIRISDLTLSTGSGLDSAEPDERNTASVDGENQSTADNADSPLFRPTVTNRGGNSPILRPSAMQLRGDKNSETILKLNRPSTAMSRDIPSPQHSVNVYGVSQPSMPFIARPNSRPVGNDNHTDDVERASHHSVASTVFDPSDPIKTNRYTGLGERLAVNGGRAEIPRLSFDCVDNILAWTYTRLALQNFGDRFRFRIDIYVGGTIAIMILLIVVSLAAVFSYNDKFNALRSSFVLQSLVTVNLIYLFLLVITYLSGLMNEKYKNQKQLLTRHCMRQRMKWLNATNLADERERLVMKRYRKSVSSDAIEMSADDFAARDKLLRAYQKEAGRIREVLEQLESFIDVLDAENDWKPFTIFGVEASTSLTMTILSSYASFIGLILMLFTSYSYAGNQLMAV